RLAVPMAMLRYFPKDGSPPVLFAIHKPVTTIGRALGNDVHIPDRSVLEHHAQVAFNGRDFQIEELDRAAEISINGKRKRRAGWGDSDGLTPGRAQLGCSMFSELQATAPAGDGEGPLAEIAGLRKLYQFSERLIRTPSVDELLETLLDDVIEITGADRGVVLLVDPVEGEGARPRVRASRNVNQETIEDASGAISDSIVKHVIETKRPIIVSDALNDTTFGKSESVLALKLSSVMCAPLMSQGEVV